MYRIHYNTYIDITPVFSILTGHFFWINFYADCLCRSVFRTNHQLPPGKVGVPKFDIAKSGLSEIAISKIGIPKEGMPEAGIP